VRERDLAGRAGQFIAEGTVVLNLLLGPQSRHRPLSLMIAENRLAGLAPTIAELPESVPVYRVTQAVMDGVTGFAIHRGVLALGERALPEEAGALLQAADASAIVVVLLGIANHDNIGGIFRNAAAFGAACVLLDQASCDPLYRKAIRVSVGSTLILPFARLAADEDVIALLETHGYTPIALSPGGRETLSEVTRQDRVALIFGTEGPGLPASILNRTRTVTIPMAAGFDSLNVATTSGIVLHHLTRSS